MRPTGINKKEIKPDKLFYTSVIDFWIINNIDYQPYAATEEDFKKFNSNQKEYDEFHSTLN